MTDRDFRVGDGKWFPIMNELAEKLATIHLSSSEQRLLWMFLRKCYGFQRSSCELRWKEIKKLTGLSQESVSRGLRKLNNKNIINTCKSQTKRIVTYKINSKLNSWKTLAKAKHLQKPNKTLAKANLSPIKETIKDITPIGPLKKRKKKKPKIPIPDDFALNDDRRVYALKNNVLLEKLDELFDDFKLHHQDNENLAVNWDRSWQTWVRNAPLYSKWAVREEEDLLSGLRDFQRRHKQVK